MVAAVLSQYPNADRMMAETLVMMHEQGKLMSFLGDGYHPDQGTRAGETEVVAEGKIEVALPDSEEKATLNTIQEWSEDKSPDSSS